MTSYRTFRAHCPMVETKYHKHVSLIASSSYLLFETVYGIGSSLNPMYHIIKEPYLGIVGRYWERSI